ncbi:hypothetical protein [Psychrobacillus psychrodurans]|uniref:hypothetical protein n=1 Tax=Psychrobacillus psychrodurans TaxID=126157 RepID=UPI0022B98303|nr:hypothetical protein [Psychrobacillus psychrodurans]MCZ8541985.1 hypothetical protein [Psychrobacillus psychrodurans]
MEREMKTMCPNCAGKETAEFMKKGDLENHLMLNKCWECDCVFISFDFKSAEELEMAVSH